MSLVMHTFAALLRPAWPAASAGLPPPLPPPLMLPPLLLLPHAWLPHLLLLVLVGGLLSGCRLREGDGDQLVVPELVRTHVYVAPGGDDSDPGTRTEPFRTLARAAQVASAGTTVHVAPGTYSGGVRSTAHGTLEARIVYRSSAPRGARIVPPLDARQGAAWDNRGNYVDIIGFEIDGGSHVGVRDNHIHHIGTEGPCETRGGAGIAIDSYYRGRDVVAAGNTVHDIGPPGCRNMHGIAVGTSASVHHNVVYRVPGAGIHLWHDASHVGVQRNTVAGAGAGIVVGGGDFYHGKGPNDYTDVSNNIVVDNDIGVIERGATGGHNRFRDNLVHGNGGNDWQLADGRQHTGTIDAPPQFVDAAHTGQPDFRLLPSSPALAPEVAGDADRPTGLAAPRKAAVGAMPAAAP